MGEKRKKGRKEGEEERRGESRGEIEKIIYITIIFLYHLLNLSGCGIGYTSTHSLN